MWCKWWVSNPYRLVSVWLTASRRIRDVVRHTHTHTHPLEWIYSKWGEGRNCKEFTQFVWQGEAVVMEETTLPCGASVAEHIRRRDIMFQFRLWAHIKMWTFIASAQSVHILQGSPVCLNDRIRCASLTLWVTNTLAFRAAISLAVVVVLFY